MNKKLLMQDMSLFALRVPVGLYMLLAGVGKVQRELQEGLGHFYSAAFKHFQPAWLPDFAAAPYGYALPWLEVLVGGLLVLGLFVRITVWVGLAMIVSFTVALVLKHETLAAQPDGPGGPFHANYIQAAAYLMLALVGGGRWSADSIKIGFKDK